MIYFIKAGQRIKIGTSKNPEARLQQLQTGNPRKLVLAFTLEGSYAEEKKLHDLFSVYRIENTEWFVQRGFLRAAIKAGEVALANNRALKNIAELNKRAEFVFFRYCKKLRYETIPKTQNGESTEEQMQDLRMYDAIRLSRNELSYRAYCGKYKRVKVNNC